MSTITTTPAGHLRGDPEPASESARFLRVLHSEWTKIRTLRSTFYTLAVFVVLAVGMTAVITVGSGGEYAEMAAEERAAFDPLELSMFSLIFAQLAVAVLGVLVMTNEYATGMIGPSLMAVPRRGHLLAAKTIAYTLLAGLAGIPTAFAMFLTGQVILDMQGAPSAALIDDGVLETVVGAGLYFTALGPIAVSVGTLLRSTAGGVATLVAGLLLAPSLTGTLPETWAEPVQKYYPTLAGAQFVIDHPAGLGPWAGFGLMCAFAAVLVAAAFVVLRRRDG
ncbi:ABC transporter permease [Actinobacteria bacterium YIM 96077]|uniref:ABC transporter permease n=1 Tax=Phytoactinopolyspora halophila TaxID=1981511 RepID=A0A329QJH2_9ACTN|nr:ABC transporter permease [Phytoactinopolyspora halophila]AYY13558.1 ABC transporter permease [Actinobacteria bacterium YIM 96077]RAW12386.1 ABC transporter permease [Phytoactinopolyspora halophila]